MKTDDKGQAERAVVLIDGSNFYHACTDRIHGVMRPRDYCDINFMTLARTLAQHRNLVSVQYYVGQLHKAGNKSLQMGQQQLFQRLKRDGVKVCTGRMVWRAPKDKASADLERLLCSDLIRNTLPQSLRRDLDKIRRQTVADAVGAWLGALPAQGKRIPESAYNALQDWRKRHSDNVVWHEKGVDVMLAVDMVDMAHKDEYDLAYLLSGDSDFVPAMRIVQAMGKQVFAVIPKKDRKSSSAISQASDVSIPITGQLLRHALRP